MNHTNKPQTDTDQAVWPQILRWEWILLAVVFIAILITRFPTLDQRLLEAHAFRQTQTAFQALQFYESGIDLLRPIIPVLGSPWTIPLEFPLFQALASIPMSWGIGADAAMRLTGLGFFIATVGGLWVLVRLVADRSVAAIAVVVFSFSPFAILWSRASLMEYLATAAALGWVISAIRWRQTSDWRWATLGTLLGTIAALVKVTTAIPWAVPILLFALPSEKLRVGSKQWIRTRIRPAYLTMLALPGLISLAWILHADAVKAASATTAWLTSGALRGWNFGTIQQRLSFTNLDVMLKRIDALILGRGLLFAVVIAVVMVKRHRPFWIGMMLVPVLAISIFFNLYLQDYYLIAVSPALAAILALGIRAIADWIRVSERWLMPALGAITLVWVGMTLGFAQYYWSPAYADIGRPASSLEIADLTEADEYSMVFAKSKFFWSPHIFYYAERRGMMLREPPLTIPIMASQPDLDRYRLLWTEEPQGPSVEFASVRPWFAPVSDRSLILGADAGELGLVTALASVVEVVPDGDGAEPLVLSATSINCNGTDAVEIPAGPGSAWLTIRTDGEARAEVREGLVTVPSATRTIIWHPDSDDGSRQPERLACFGGGRLSIESAVVITSEA